MRDRKMESENLNHEKHKTRRNQKLPRVTLEFKMNTRRIFTICDNIFRINLL